MPWIIDRWDIIVYFRENNFWQMGHLVCPLWILLWCANESLRLKTLPHSLHTYFAGEPEDVVGTGGSWAPESSYDHWATTDRENHLYFSILIVSKGSGSIIHTQVVIISHQGLYFYCFQSAFICCLYDVQIVRDKNCRYRILHQQN